MKFKIILVITLFTFNNQIKCAAADDGSSKWLDDRKEQAKVREECSWEETSTQMKSSLASFFDEAINADSDEKFFKENANLINTQDPFTLETPLIKAAKLGKEKAIKAIVEVSGINLNLKDKDGKTALIHAVLGGSLNIVAALLAKGAELDHQDSKKYTAVMYSIALLHKAILALLLPYGPDMSLKSGEEDASYLAVMSGDEGIIDMVTKATLEFTARVSASALNLDSAASLPAS